MRGKQFLYSRKQTFYSSSKMDPTHPAAITIASAPCSRYVTFISLFSLSSKKSHNKLEENATRKKVRF